MTLTHARLLVTKSEWLQWTHQNRFTRFLYLTPVFDVFLTTTVVNEGCLVYCRHVSLNSWLERACVFNKVIVCVYSLYCIKLYRV